MTKKFNYCIGTYWDKDNKESIGCYMIHGQEIWYGDEDDANETLEYVKKHSSFEDRDYQVFVVVPKTEYDVVSEKAWMYDDLCE